MAKKSPATEQILYTLEAGDCLFCVQNSLVLIMYVHYADADISPWWQVHREYVAHSYSAQVSRAPALQARN